MFGEGRTAQACVNDTRKALVASVATMLEADQLPPLPASEGKRTEQVNIKLTCEEESRLTTLAQSQGSKGLSDYMRAKALVGA